MPPTAAVAANVVVLLLPVVFPELVLAVVFAVPVEDAPLPVPVEDASLPVVVAEESLPVVADVASLLLDVSELTVVAVFPCVAEYDRSYVVVAARASTGAAISRFAPANRGHVGQAEDAAAKRQTVVKRLVGRIATTVGVYRPSEPVSDCRPLLRRCLRVRWVIKWCIRVPWFPQSRCPARHDPLGIKKCMCISRTVESAVEGEANVSRSV